MTDQSTPALTKAGREDDSAGFDSAALTHAARDLNRLRVKARQNHGLTTRKHTGIVFGRRARVGLAVILPDGKPGWVKKVQRGHACIRTTEPFEDTFLHIYLPVATLRPYQSPAAAMLGRAKRGVIERKSKVKAESSRRNGALPAKPGNRPRGRPRDLVNHSNA
jgi:hypothetical protein